MLAAEHVALACALAAGFLLMRERGWPLLHARWLGLKVGIVAFLVVPLEGLHAWVCHRWIARGLRQTSAPPFSKDLARGAALDDMVRALAAVLLAVALPLLVWLSVAKPL